MRTWEWGEGVGTILQLALGWGVWGGGRSGSGKSRGSNHGNVMKFEKQWKCSSLWIWPYQTCAITEEDDLWNNSHWETIMVKIIIASKKWESRPWSLAYLRDNVISPLGSRRTTIIRFLPKRFAQIAEGPGKQNKGPMSPPRVQRLEVLAEKILVWLFRDISSSTFNDST